MTMTLLLQCLYRVDYMCQNNYPMPTVPPSGQTMVILSYKRSTENKTTASSFVGGLYKLLILNYEYYTICYLALALVFRVLYLIYIMV